MDTLKYTIEYLEDEHEEILAFCNKMKKSVWKFFTEMLMRNFLGEL